MFQIDSPGNVAGQFTEGDPGVTSPTIVSADWLNAVQDELVNVIEAAGIDLDKLDSAQLLAALNLLYRPRTAWKRQLTLYNETTIAGFNSHALHNLGELPTVNGEIFEATTMQVDFSVLYSMVVRVEADCTIPIVFVFNDDAGLFFVDGVQVAGGTAGSTSPVVDSIDLEEGEHVIQVLNNNTGGDETQLVLSEWMTPQIKFLRAATA